VAAEVTPKLRTFIAVSVPLVLADGVTKEVAARGLRPPHVPHPLLGDWLRLTLTFNREGAMGLTLGAWSRPAFAALALCALGVLGLLLLRTPPADRLRASALGLLAAGAAGNLWDRLRWGHGVVDFIDVGLGQIRFWTFNIADASLTVGAALLAWVVWREDAATRRAPTRP
jgi:signal peptidase II